MATLTPKPLVEGVLLAGSAGTVYTVPPATAAVIRSITFCNTDGAVATTVTLHLVPSGGAVDPANMLYNALPIEAGQTLESDTLRVLLAGGTIRAFAGVANKVSLRVDGSELT